MLTIDEHVCAAPPEVAFGIAADVEAWPGILSHYRWVRFHREEQRGTDLVEMAAWRRFGPIRYPTWWISEMEQDRKARVIRYRHVEGITRGMDVHWEVEGLPAGGSHLRIIHEWSGPGWPLVGGLAASWVIGPGFIRHIAARTLAGIAAEAERRHRIGG